MGKFKELSIDNINNGIDFDYKIEPTPDYSKYNDEIISDFNNGKIIKIKLKDYLKKSNKRTFIFAPLEGKVHLWDWSNFKDEVNGRLLSYETDNNLILLQIIEIDDNTTLSEELLNKYNLKILKRLK